jgi:arabinofuranan 3-O-arabinosyltransferase
VSRRVEIQASPHPRTLETTENYSSGWRARIGDEELVPLRVDGWRQAFLLPPGASGVAELRFEPDRTYRRGLLMGALAAMGLVILTALRGTSSSPRVGPADRAGLVLVSVLALAALAGGWLALAVGASAVGMVRVLRIRTSGAAAWRIAGMGAIGAAAILAVAMPLLPWPGRLGHEGLHTSLATALPLFILSIVAAAGRLPDRVVSVPTTGCSDSPAGSN